MHLTVLGSGSAAPFADRVCPGHWVEAGALRLLLDCGNGVLHRLATLGLPWGDVTHVLLTHFHVDHVGDLPALLVALRWGQLPARTEPLTVIGPVGTKAWFARLGDAHGDTVREPGFPLEIIELPAGDALVLNSQVTLASIAVPHTPESMAYSISRGAARLVYTGDTGPDDALADWAQGCSLLLTECSLPASMAIASHLTPERAGALAARARPDRLVLTHFYPPVLSEDIAALVASQWNGPLSLATDGMMFALEE
jgi:ribonuclease BN (tRNA processing enzyme)